MRKGFITLALAAMLACGGMGMLNASAETELKGTSWKNASGAGVATHDATTGYTKFTGMKAYGNRMYAEEAVKVDGLTVYFAADEGEYANGVFGFGFLATNDAGNYSPDTEALDIHARPGYANVDGVRFFTGASHDPAKKYAANSIENAQNGVVDTADGTGIICTTGLTSFELKYEFDYVEVSNVWSITITVVEGNRPGVQAETVTQYIKGDYINAVLNDEGKAIVSTWCMSAEAAFSLKLEEEKEVITTVENKEWDIRPMSEEMAAAHNPKVEYEVETGWNVFSGFTGWGIGAGNVHKVDVDGLVVELYTNSFADKDFFGFGFSSAVDGYAPDAANSLCATIWPCLHSQGRLVTNNSHNPASGITFLDEALTNKGGDGTFVQSIVMNNPSEYGFKLTFSKVNDSVYKVVVEITAGAKWGSQPNPVTLYFSADYINSVADENGLVYLTTYGSANANTVFKLRYTDAISAEYEAGLEAAKANLVAKVEAFEAAVAALGTESWAPAYAAYEAAIEARIAIWDNDADATLDARLSAAADTFAAAVKAHTDALDACDEAAYNATLTAINQLTASSYAAAVEALDAYAAAIEEHTFALDAATVASYVEAYEYYAPYVASVRFVSIEDAFAAAEAAVAAFEANVGSADIAYYNNALEAVSAANATLASDKDAYGMTAEELAEYEAVAAEWPTRIDAAKEAFDAAEEALVAVNQLDTAYALVVRAINTAKANPTNETYDAAKKALDEANAKYATLKSKISAKKQASFEATAQQCATDLEAVKATIPAEGFGCTGVVVDTIAPVFVAFAAAMLLKKRKEN